MVIGKLLHSTLKESKIIMLELPEESYFEQNYNTIKVLQKAGYSCVYVSFHRPFSSISSLLKKHGVDLKTIIFIDVAAALTQEKENKKKSEVKMKKDERCISISKDINVDELVKAVYTSLDTLKGKRFIFIDSLTTLTLYKPLSETLRFSEFLMRTVKNEKDVRLIFNVAQGLTQKKFIQDVALKVDKTLKVN